MMTINDILDERNGMGPFFRSWVMIPGDHIVTGREYQIRRFFGIYYSTLSHAGDTYIIGFSLTLMSAALSCVAYENNGIGFIKASPKIFIQSLDNETLLEQCFWTGLSGSLATMLSDELKRRLDQGIKVPRVEVFEHEEGYSLSVNDILIMEENNDRADDLRAIAYRLSIAYAHDVDAYIDEEENEHEQ